MTSLSTRPSTKSTRYCPFRATLISSLVAVLGALMLPALASAALEEYGIESVEASLSTLEAGRHPDVLTTIEFDESAEPAADTESLAVELPPGLTANPKRFPSCSLAKFNEQFAPCPQDSQVGLVEVRFAGFPTTLQEPLFNLEAPEDKVARLGFVGIAYPYILQVDLRSGSDYGVTVRSEGMPSFLHLRSVKANTWGVPADHAHDTERLNVLEAFFCAELGERGPCLVGGSRESLLAPEPFMTNPASCQPMIFDFETTAYGFPGRTFSATADAGDIVGCERTHFDPFLAISPTSSRAGAPTGLEATMQLPQDEAVNTPNPSPLRSAKVVLPEGMTVNASAADGLQGCSVEEAAYKTPGPSACPAASKLGSATIVSPALKRPIQGGIFLRTPDPGHLFRFWLVTHELGVNLKLPAEVKLNERTGSLTTVIQESPQLPTEEVVLRLNGGARAPLRNPQTCGTFNATYELEPWSGSAAASGVVPITIDQGCETGGFAPKLSGGTINPAAGDFSPFVFDLSREDGEQNLAAIDVKLPEGLTAKLAGVPVCPPAAAASGACPVASQIGVVKAAIGAGTQPLWVPQADKSPTAVYLAGPYKGGPYSLVATVPAQAGPFDLGTVVVRSAIHVDPTSAQVSVKSDPLPQILQGVPVDYRRVRVEVNRNRFTLNPTSCDPMQISGTATSVVGATAPLSSRFQAGNCSRLAFDPRLGIRLSGSTQRGKNPALRAVLTQPTGEANIAKVSVVLPKSEFIDTRHINGPCTRVQFNAGVGNGAQCPAKSVLGYAKAFTPLLDKPLEGPVYFRSNGGERELPDLVASLDGQVHLNVVGFVDSVGKKSSGVSRVRTTFATVPDAPVTEFTLSLKGGKKGLLQNSANLCKVKNVATLKLVGQNGKVESLNPPIANRCGSEKRASKGSNRRGKRSGNRFED